jgi:hypothetical protein
MIFKKALYETPKLRHLSLLIDISNKEDNLQIYYFIMLF